MGYGGLWGSLSGQVDPNKVRQDMTYQVDRTGINFANSLQGGINQQNQLGAQYGKQAQGFFNQASQALNPNSGYNQSILGMINQQAGQQSADTLAQQSMLGGRQAAMQGGNSGILAAQGRTQANQAAGQLGQQRNQNNMNWMQGMSGRASQIAGIGQGIGTLGAQAYGQAGQQQATQAGLYGQYANSQNQMLADRAEGYAQAGISNRQQSGNMFNSLLSGGLALAAAGPTGGLSLLGWGMGQAGGE